MNTQHSHQTKIAYVLSGFPSLSETFILQEILELERQGLLLHLFSLEKPSAEVDAARDLQSPITYFNQISLPTLLEATVRCFFHAPLHFLSILVVLFIHYRQCSVLRHILYAAYLSNQLKLEG